MIAFIYPYNYKEKNKRIMIYGVNDSRRRNEMLKCFIDAIFFAPTPLKNFNFHK